MRRSTLLGSLVLAAAATISLAPGAVAGPAVGTNQGIDTVYYDGPGHSNRIGESFSGCGESWHDGLTSAYYTTKVLTCPRSGQLQ